MAGGALTFGIPAVGFRQCSKALGALGMAALVSGCVAAAAVPMLAASFAVSGFTTYKFVQSASGGEIAIAFPEQGGKVTPAPPLPEGQRAAIWPGDEFNVLFAEALSNTGGFDVTSPGQVSSILQDENIATSLSSLTSTEQADAFAVICDRADVDIVFASNKLGVESNQNFFSLSRADMTSRADLYGYSCASGTIAWREQMAVVVKMGSSMPSSGEINKVAADAWAERVMEARANA